MIMGIIGFSSLFQAQGHVVDNNGKRVLVAYFSCTGTTERAANAIANAVGGTIYQITPAKAYTPADLDWNDKSSRSSMEMADEKSRPELGGAALDVQDYDVVFLGYPIWWDLCPRPVNTFVEKYGLSGKTVIPFATSGGSSITGSVRQLKKLYPDVRWKEGRLCNGSPKQTGDWAKRAIE